MKTSENGSGEAAVPFHEVSIAETKDGASPIPRLDAFRSFQSGLKERCIEPPQQTEATIVGDYQMLSEA